MSKSLNKVNREDLSEFGQILQELSIENHLDTPLDIAKALLGDKDLRKIIEPSSRVQKESKEEYKEQAVTRAIQKHYSIQNVYKVQSKYIYAYSRLFNCSIDYLYGFTKIKSKNMEIREICELTGLSENSITRLLDNKSESTWWSKLFESQLFFEMPRCWNAMYGENLTYRLKSNDAKSINEILDDINAENNERAYFDLITNDDYKTLIDIRYADAAYYGHLAKLNSEITQYYIHTTSAND